MVNVQWRRDSNVKGFLMRSSNQLGQTLEIDQNVLQNWKRLNIFWGMVEIVVFSCFWAQEGGDPEPKGQWLRLDFDWNSMCFLVLSATN